MALLLLAVAAAGGYAALARRPLAPPVGRGEAGGGGPGPVQPPQVIHPLTGLPVAPDALRRRVVAVAVDNLRRARPQYGLPAADLVYEVPVEGGITRFVALFWAGEAERVGPVRSSRHDMLDLVLEWDAVWVHAGGSPYHYGRVEALGIDDIDEVRARNHRGVFWRDRRRRAPHNLFTSTARIRAKLAELGWEREPAVMVGPFRFVPAEQLPPGEPALEAVVPFPGAQRETVAYRYDPARGLYVRYAGGEPHLDGASGQPLTAANVILQFVEVRRIPGDEEGRLELTLVGEGPLQVLSAGHARPGSWRKDGPSTRTRYLEPDGQPLRLRPGQTWILLVPRETRVRLGGGD